jgi:lysyl-tRNA synthetase class 2
MTNNNWQTTSTLNIIQTRAKLISLIHEFFLQYEVLQVDTPVISRFANTDPSINSFYVQEKLNFETQDHFYLHTSPEFPMKRLLANGMGSIYQICKVFRSCEKGRYHNPEFTLLEWYRVGIDHFELMSEIELLFNNINEQFPFYETCKKYSYQNLFLEYCGIDPLTASVSELIDYIRENTDDALQGVESMTFDELCDYLMSHIIQSKMPDKSLIFVYDYPASQASLAQLNDNLKTARRFEVFVSGVELANGFHELQDADEQRQRFLKEQQTRVKAKQHVYPMDENLLQALESGLPDCAGVALGLDRLLMLLVNAKHINEVITFPFDRA